LIALERIEKLDLLRDVFGAVLIPPAVASEFGRAAKAQGVRFLGLLGVLLHAKRKRKLRAIRPMIEALRAKRFFVSEALAREAFRLAGE
jgi:predicted nucleic acid-binding protein